MKGDCIKGSKVLRKLLSGALLARSGNDPQVWVSSGGGWNIVTADSGAIFAIQRDYFDISGWNAEQLTAFITGVSYQESDVWAMPQATIGSYPNLRSWDIISKSYLNDDIVDAAHWVVPPNAQGFNPPGMALSKYNLEEIFDGRFRSWVNDSTTASNIRLNAGSSWGTGDATAGDKIYITRIILLSNVQAVNGVVNVPPMSIVVPAVVVQEKDLVFMERLRRSYVLGEERV